MITQFENETADLSEKEKCALPILVALLNARSVVSAVNGPLLLHMINNRPEVLQKKLTINDIRLRKTINYLRSKSILPIVASPRGYYVEYNVKALERQVKSLRERAAAINHAAEGIETIINNLKTKTA
jgi:hypothetical protein